MIDKLDIDDDWDNEYEHSVAAPTRAAPRAMPSAAPSPVASPSMGPTPALRVATATPEPRAFADFAAEGSSPWEGAAIPHKKKSSVFPAFIARSSMFRASAGDGDFLSFTTIPCASGSIELQGPKLTMRDKRVWEIAVQLAKERAEGIGSRFEVELREFARRMGQEEPNGKALHSIWSSLERLASTRVRFNISAGKCKGVGSLIATAACIDGKRFIRLNPDFALPALKCDNQFAFNAARRANLSTSLAQWLHDYFSTHSQAKPVDLRYLRALCGFEGVDRNFPSKLEAAMNELAAKAPEVVASYAIDKPTKCSTSWTLMATLGAEPRTFEKATAMPSEPKSGVRL